jgi:hypothetical protein
MVLVTECWPSALVGIRCMRLAIAVLLGCSISGSAVLGQNPPACSTLGAQPIRAVQQSHAFSTAVVAIWRMYGAQDGVPSQSAVDLDCGRLHQEPAVRIGSTTVQIVQLPLAGLREPELFHVMFAVVDDNRHVLLLNRRLGDTLAPVLDPDNWNQVVRTARPRHPLSDSSTTFTYACALLRIAGPEYAGVSPCMHYRAVVRTTGAGVEVELPAARKRLAVRSDWTIESLSLP